MAKVRRGVEPILMMGSVWWRGNKVRMLGRMGTAGCDYPVMRA